jgi:hypothetical protein
MAKFILAKDDENQGPYQWTNVNRRDYFGWEGAWAESFASEEWAIFAAEQRTKEGWIVDCYHNVGYTVNSNYGDDECLNSTQEMQTEEHITT